MAVEMRAAAVEPTGDFSADQLDRSFGCELAVEVHAPADFHPGGSQGIAVAVGAVEMGPAAVEPTGDFRAGQPDRPGGGEPAVEVHITADLQAVGGKGVTVTVAAIEMSAAAD